MRRVMYLPPKKNSFSFSEYILVIRKYESSLTGSRLKHFYMEQNFIVFCTLEDKNGIKS